MAIKSKTFTVDAAVMRRFSEGREYKFKLHGAKCVAELSAASLILSIRRKLNASLNS
jgi:hypothetical protein